jgi:hypothetical protein
MRPVGRDGKPAGRWKRWRAERALQRLVTSGSETVTAAVYHSEAEAFLAQGLLVNAGVPATVRIDSPEFGIGFVEAARVIVRRRHLAEAKAILDVREREERWDQPPWSGTHDALGGHHDVAMEYTDISGETWAEIYYLAKRRERHPDPEVAYAAYVWATDVRAERGRMWLKVAFMATLEALLGGGGASAGSELGAWWQARRIWRLGPPEVAG